MKSRAFFLADFVISAYNIFDHLFVPPGVGFAYFRPNLNLIGPNNNSGLILCDIIFVSSFCRHRLWSCKAVWWTKSEKCAAAAVDPERTRVNPSPIQDGHQGLWPSLQALDHRGLGCWQKLPPRQVHYTTGVGTFPPLPRAFDVSSLQRKPDSEQLRHFGVIRNSF